MSKKDTSDKPKKPIYKKWWFWVIVVIVLAAIFGNRGGKDSGAEQAAAPTAETSVAFTPEAAEEASAPAEEAVPADSDTALSADAIVAALRLTVAENYQNYDVTFDNSVVTVNVWADGVSVGAVAAAGGDADALEAWNTMIDSTASFCADVQDTFSENGHDNIVVTVNILNDANTENVLATIIAGSVFYDAVNDVDLIG